MDEQNSITPVQPEVKAEKKQNSSLANEILVWGILGLAFAATSNAIVGLIFSLIALKKVKEYKNGGFEPCRFVDIGNGLATAGKIVSIVAFIIIGVILAIWLTIFLLAVVIGGVALGSLGGSEEIEEAKTALTIISML